MAMADLRAKANSMTSSTVSDSTTSRRHQRSMADQRDCSLDDIDRDDDEGDQAVDGGLVDTTVGRPKTD